MVVFKVVETKKTYTITELQEDKITPSKWTDSLEVDKNYVNDLKDYISFMKNIDKNDIEIIRIFKEIKEYKYEKRGRPRKEDKICM